MMNQEMEIELYKKQLSIMREKYEIANKWIYLMNRNISMKNVLYKKGIRQVILYGASDLAVRFIEYCEKENYLIRAIADKQIKHYGSSYRGIPLVSIDELAEMDLCNTYLVIMAIGYCDEIKNDFKQRNIKNVISFREIIESAL